jgi:hypothetical protein
LSEEDSGQDKQKAGDAEVEDAMAAIESPVCACIEDLLPMLLPDLTPHAASSKSSLHRFTCPGCGQVYLTNAMNDLCLDCQEKGVQPPGPGVTSQG